MLQNCPVAGDDLERGWTGRESPAIERVGGERGGGIERRLGAREVTGTQSISLLFSLVQEDYPIKQFSLWGREKKREKKRQLLTAFLRDTSRRHVAAGGFAFDVHCCQQCF